MSDKVVLLIGAGIKPHRLTVGLATIQKFTQEGWKVAAVSRSAEEEIKNAAALTIQDDLSNPESIAGVFKQVTEELGVPSVVIYNAYASVFLDGQEPFSSPVSTLVKDTVVNSHSFYATIQAALEGFSKLPDSVPKTVIFTGNFQTRHPWPKAPNLGIGKAASEHMVKLAHFVYGDRHRFYYADERRADGKPAYLAWDGAAHADTFWELATGPRLDGWEVNFVKGEGIKFFGADVGGWKGEHLE